MIAVTRSIQEPISTTPYRILTRASALSGGRSGEARGGDAEEKGEETDAGDEPATAIGAGNFVARRQGIGYQVHACTNRPPSAEYTVVNGRRPCKDAYEVACQVVLASSR